MDTLNIILNETINNNIDWKMVISTIKDLVTIGGIIAAFYFGNKGIKKIISNNIIKSKIIDLNEKNKKVNYYTNKIISEIYNTEKEIGNRPVEDDDLKYIRKVTQELVKIAEGSSTEIATLSFLLCETAKNVKTKIEKNNKGIIKRVEIRFASDFYNLVYNTSLKIHNLSSIIVDIPKTIKLKKHNEIKKEIAKYMKRERNAKTIGIDYGVNLNPNTQTAMIFDIIIHNSTDSYIFNKNFFMVIRSNIPIIYKLYLNKIYFPAIFETKEKEPIFGKRKLHIVKIKIIEGFNERNETFERVIFTYSNLNPLVRFVKGMKKEEVKEKYVDGFIENESSFKNMHFEIKKLQEESFEIEIEKKKAQEYYNNVKKKMRNKLKKLRKEY